MTKLLADIADLLAARAPHVTFSTDVSGFASRRPAGAVVLLIDDSTPSCPLTLLQCWIGSSLSAVASDRRAAVEVEVQLRRFLHRPDGPPLRLHSGAVLARSEHTRMKRGAELHGGGSWTLLEFALAIATVE